MRILLDKDGVLYDLHQLWYDQHNIDHNTVHTLTKADVTTWDTSKPCKENKCPVDIFSYLEDPKLWINGDPIPGSIETTQKWTKDHHELVVITRVANSQAAKPSWDWLNIFFPHIPNIMMVTGDIKDWAMADVLIDDAIHNLTGFKGISILLDQPWNRSDDKLIRARDWDHLDVIINRADYYLELYADFRPTPYNWIEARIKTDIKDGTLI